MRQQPLEQIKQFYSYNELDIVIISALHSILPKGRHSNRMTTNAVAALRGVTWYGSNVHDQVIILAMWHCMAWDCVEPTVKKSLPKKPTQNLRLTFVFLISAPATTYHLNLDHNGSLTTPSL